MIGVAAASTACRQSASDENVTIDHHNAATTDIESLPPDESVATPTDELVNGDGEPANSAEPPNADTAQH
jgi:hypothetical protein